MDDVEKFLTANLTSYHFDRSKKRNEKNYGIGYEEKDGDFSKMAGIYKNSFNKNSLYGLMGYTPVHIGNVDAGVLGGAVSGYHKYPIPALGLLMQYDNGKYGANLTAMPPASIKGKKMNGFLGLQLKKSLD